MFYLYLNKMTDMADNVIIDQIEFFADEASRAGNPRHFLERISGQGGLHYVWHFRGGRASLGFFLFHWHLVKKVEELGIDLTPLTEADFSQGGTYYSPSTDWNRIMRPRMRPVKSLEELALFSLNFEGWHNPVHGVLEGVSGLPMGDGAINVLYKLFWDFHSFVNGIFEWQLENYAKSNNLPFDTIIQYVEDQPISIVARI